MIRGAVSSVEESRTPLQRISFVMVCLSVVTLIVSIAASQAFLALAAVALAADGARARRWPLAAPPILLPLGLFVLWTLFAVAFSDQPVVSLRALKKFLPFVSMFLLYSTLRTFREGDRLLRAALVAGSSSAVLALVQFSITGVDWLNRATGWMSHWMTLAGQLMILLVVALSWILFAGDRARWWGVPAAVAMAGGLVVSLTRNAWLGALVGLFAVVAVRRRMAVLFLVALLPLAWVLPASLQERLRAGFDLQDATTAGRLAIARTGLRMIADHPWFGVGPRRVMIESPRYFDPGNTYPAWSYMHLHNNYLQIAAERGIPALLLWLWLMARFGWDSVGHWRRATGRRRYPAVAAFGTLVAFLMAGLLEYNFGDYEVVTLFLAVLTIPYALDRSAAAA